MVLEKYNSLYIPKEQYGFVNIGNTCFLNSLCQALLSCSSFNKRVIQKQYEIEKTELGKRVYNMVYNYVKNINTANMGSSLIQRQLVLNGSIDFSQQCAMEVLDLILDLLNVDYITNAFMHRYRCSLLCQKCDTIMNKVDMKNDTVDESTTIKLFQEIKNKEDFLSKIHLHISETDLLCDNCNNKKVRLYYLTMLPEIVIVILNKYANPKPLIEYPNKLLIKESNNTYLEYIQVAQILHSGSINGGHYYSECLRNNKYYRLNDQHVEEINNLEINQNTYAIVYHYNLISKK